MNSVDLALAMVLGVFALRGYWRGFFRESFGLLAVVGGSVAALRFTAPGAALVQQRLPLPSPLETGVAFIVIIVVVHTVVNLMGVLLDRLASALFLRRVNRLVGA